MSAAPATLLPDAPTTAPTAGAEPRRSQRDRILDAAVTCFARHGFHGASMQQICAEAGMSPGALYRYFPSKDAIIAAIVEEDRKQNAANMARLKTAPSLVDGLMAAGREFLSEGTRPGCARIGPEVLAEAIRNPKMRELFDPVQAQVRGAMREALQAAVERGEADPSLDVDAVVTIFDALGDGLLIQLLMRPEQDLEALMPTLERLVRRFLAPPADHCG